MREQEGPMANLEWLKELIRADLSLDENEKGKPEKKKHSS